MSQTQPGGAAGKNGAGYEMLWAVLRLMDINIKEPAEIDPATSEVVAKVTIVLEPAGGGGDIREHVGSRRTIVQLKARSGDGVWSLQEIVRDVIPDLYKAVDLDIPNTEFKFVTEGRMGKWQEVLSFFEHIRTLPFDSSNPLGPLKATGEVHFQRTARRPSHPGEAAEKTKGFWSREHYSERDLFDRIVKEIMDCPSIDDSRVMVHAKLWHLLAGLRFEWSRKVDDLEDRVCLRLLDLIGNASEVDPKRQELLWALLELARCGNAHVEANEFLHEHGLNAVPLTNWQKLRARSQQQVAKASQWPPFDYRSSEDPRPGLAVRALARWSETDHSLLLIGPSGVGKSCLLAALGEAITRDSSGQQELVILMRSCGSAAVDMEGARRVFWEDIRNEDKVGASLHRIRARLRELDVAAPLPWLTLLIDGIATTREAIHLLCERWTEWGVKLALSMQPEVGRAVVEQMGSRVLTIEVPQFAPTELEQYLSREIGADWLRIPPEVFQLLRTPLFAHLFVTIPPHQAWEPKHEYELLERQWARLASPVAADRPTVPGSFKNLIRSFLNRDVYPWTNSDLSSKGLRSDEVVALGEAGWLSGINNSKFEVPHDRLLNWAVAEALVEDADSKQISGADLGTMLLQFLDGSIVISGHILDNAAMDVIWLLSKRKDLASILQDVLQKFEDLPYHYAETFYRKLLPKLGQIILPALACRLKAVADDGDRSHLGNQIVATFIAIGTGAGPIAASLLGSDSHQVQLAATRILAKQPDPSALDRLWEIHRAMAADPKAYFGLENTCWAAPRDPYRAMAACAAVQPDWLLRTLKQANKGDPVEKIGYILSGINCPDLWPQIKEVLREKLPESELCCFAMNVRRHRDRAEVGWLVERLGDVAVGAHALQALAAVDPDRATAELHRVDPEEMCATRGWALMDLMARRPDATRTALLDIMKHAADPWSIIWVFVGHENLADSATAEVILNALEGLLDQRLSRADGPHDIALGWALKLVSAMCRLELLEAIQRRKGSPLEAKLAQWLLRIGPRPGLSTDRLDREPGLDVLYKIGGKGFTPVVNVYLQANSWYGRSDALKCSAKRPDAATVNLLRHLALDPGVQSERVVESNEATRSLGTAGHWDGVVDALVSLGMNSDLRLMASEAAGFKLDDKTLRSALAVLDASAQGVTGALLAIGISGRPDLLPRVRSALQSSAPDSAVASAAAVALDLLGDSSEDSIEQLCALLPIQPAWVTPILIRMGTNRALKALLDHLHSHFDEHLAVALLQTSVGVQAAEMIRSRLKNVTSVRSMDLIRWDSLDVDVHRALMNETPSSDLVELTATYAEGSPTEQMPSISDYMRERALWPQGMRSVTRHSTAIRCLAAAEPELAFKATRFALNDRDLKCRTEYPYLLVELDAERGLEVLLDQALRERSTGVLWAIARALPAVGTARIMEWLISGSCEQRLAACRLAARMQPSKDLVAAIRVCLDDADIDVADAARDTWLMLFQSEEAEKLLTRFSQEKDSDQRWILLDCLIDLADPGDKAGPWPPWVEQIAADIPYMHRLYLGERLGKRQEEVAKEAESRDKSL